MYFYISSLITTLILLILRNELDLTCIMIHLFLLYPIVCQCEWLPPLPLRHLLLLGVGCAGSAARHSAAAKERKLNDDDAQSRVQAEREEEEGAIEEQEKVVRRLILAAGNNPGNG